MARQFKTLSHLKPTEARKAVMSFLMFLRSEGSTAANMGALVLDESDGYEWGVTLGQALDVIARADAAKMLPSGGAR